MSEDTKQGGPHADEWDDEDLTLTERVERLEEAIDDIHLSEQEERDLAAAIEHLGANATSLAKALLDVDQNQKDLIRLRRRIQTVADTTATTDEVDAKTKLLRDQHRSEMTRMKGLFFSACVIAIGLLGATIFIGLAYAKANEESQQTYTNVNAAVCDQRSQQANVIQDFIQVQIDRVKSSTVLNAEQKQQATESYQQLLRAFPDVDCGRLR